MSKVYNFVFAWICLLIKVLLLALCLHIYKIYQILIIIILYRLFFMSFILSAFGKLSCFVFKYDWIRLDSYVFGLLYAL